MIETRGLTKRYGNKRHGSTVAVDGLGFDVRPGAVTGFLGPNGSGKSTTVRLLALMAEGRSNAAIAQALAVSAGTVEKHIAAVFAKPGLPSSEDANRRVPAVLGYLGA